MAKRAVIVGCTYAETSKKLKGTGDDATSISKMIQEVHGVPKENITVFREGGKYSQPVTGANVRKAVADACAASEAGDCLLFFFAGCGTRLPLQPKNPEWAMVMADYDIITRADLNEIFSACPQGVGFTVISDAASSHALLPYPVANGADEKTRYVKAGGRFMSAAKYITAFNTLYPEANMTKETIVEVMASQFPEEAGGPSKAAKKNRPAGGGGGGGRRHAWGWRTRSAGPIGEGQESDEDGEEGEEEAEGGRERRGRDDEEGDARRRNRRGRGDGEEEEGEEEPVEEEAPAEDSAEEEAPVEEPVEEEPVEEEPAEEEVVEEEAAEPAEEAAAEEEPTGGPPAGRWRRGWRASAAGPLGEGRERDDDEEGEDEGRGRRERRGRDDDDGDARRQRRRERRRTEGRDSGSEEDCEDDCEEGEEDPALDGKPARPPAPQADGPPAVVKPPGRRPKPDAEAEEDDEAEEEATGDETAYEEDRDWPAPVDENDDKIRPHQGVLFSAGMFRSFVPDQKAGGAFTRALVAAVRAAAESDPDSGISNVDLMGAIEATLAEGAFKMTPTLCGSDSRVARPFFQV